MANIHCAACNTAKPLNGSCSVCKKKWHGAPGTYTCTCGTQYKLSNALYDHPDNMFGGKSRHTNLYLTGRLGFIIAFPVTLLTVANFNPLDAFGMSVVAGFATMAIVAIADQLIRSAA